MSRFLAYHFLTGTGVSNDACQITHRAGRNEQPRFATENLSRTFLKAIDGRIFDEDIVTDFGFRHRTAHFRRWSGYGVASEVNNSVGHNNSSVTLLATSQPAGVSFRMVPSKSTNPPL